MIGGAVIPRARCAAAPLGADLRQQLFASASLSVFHLQIRTATKRGGGSSRNGRDSAGKRLGVKKFTDQYVLPGQIIVRQRGTTMHAGQSVGVGKDFTLFALEPGYVKFYSHHLPFPHAPPRNAAPILGAPAADALVSAQANTAPAVKRPRGMRQYVGIVREKEDRLPRDVLTDGLDRRFWGWPKESEADF